jgi:copper oxidase (laccase) domain-containing protein
MTTLELTELFKSSALTFADCYEDGWTNVFHGLVHGLPIGNIGEPADAEGAISADSARIVVAKMFEERPPITHLALAPHPRHDNITVLDAVPKADTVVVADGVICPVSKTLPSLMFATMVGDCPTIMVTGEYRVAFLHCGAPEAFDGLLSEFMKAWGEEQIHHVSITPGIRGASYELPSENVPANFMKFAVPTSEDGKIGFDCLSAILDTLTQMGVSRDTIIASEVDVFSANEESPDQSPFASHRWYRSRCGQFSPRDLAIAIVSPGPNWESPGHDLV